MHNEIGMFDVSVTTYAAIQKQMPDVSPVAEVASVTGHLIEYRVSFFFSFIDSLASATSFEWLKLFDWFCHISFSLFFMFIFRSQAKLLAMEPSLLRIGTLNR